MNLAYSNNGNAGLGFVPERGFAMNPETYLYFAYGSNMVRQAKHDTTSEMKGVHSG